MKKVILFSPNGYIGGFLRERLTLEDCVQLYEMTRGSDFRQFENEYDIMIYSAALTSSRNEVFDRYVQDNVVKAVSIVNFCKEHNIKRIIYLSTDEIYGELNADIVTEKTVMVNPNLYATTKYLAEKIIMESTIPYYIIRLPGVVGRIWRKNFVYNLMTKISRNEKVELYNINRNFNNIVDLDDLINFIVLLCKNNDCEKREIFLLGNIEKIKLLKLVEYMKTLYFSSSQISSIETNKRRYFTLDVSKAVAYGYSSKNMFAIIDGIYCMQGEMD